MSDEVQPTDCFTVNKQWLWEVNDCGDQNWIHCIPDVGRSKTMPPVLQLCPLSSAGICRGGTCIFCPTGTHWRQIHSQTCIICIISITNRKTAPSRKAAALQLGLNNRTCKIPIMILLRVHSHCVVLVILAIDVAYYDTSKGLFTLHVDDDS